MQNITIAGRLGRDAELRSTQQGDKVCGFTVAVDYRDGRDKKTNWWRVSLWGKRGEALAQYLTKGASVTVTGEFSLGEYDGKPQLNIRAYEITLQGGKSSDGASGQRQQNSAQNGGGGGWGDTQTNRGSLNEDLDDDIPFITNQGIW